MKTWKTLCAERIRLIERKHTDGPLTDAEQARIVEIEAIMDKIDMETMGWDFSRLGALAESQRLRKVVEDAAAILKSDKLLKLQKAYRLLQRALDGKEP